MFNSTYFIYINTEVLKIEIELITNRITYPQDV